MKRIIAQVRKELTQFSRDKMTVVLALVLPLIIMWLLGCAVSLTVTDLPVVVQDWDQTVTSRRYYDTIKSSLTFRVVELGLNESPESALDKGKARAAIVIPQYRPYPDLIADLIASGGGDPAAFSTAAAMQAELCSTSAAVMALLLQAYAEGLGACWMAGPMVARREIEAALGIAPPWRMIGAIALGHPAAAPTPKPRKPLERVVSWIED